jgi:hypothetical protein
VRLLVQLAATGTHQTIRDRLEASNVDVAKVTIVPSMRSRPDLVTVELDDAPLTQQEVVDVLRASSEIVMVIPEPDAVP